MQIDSPAVVLATRQHGETALIARVLTRQYGMMVGYVAGGRGRRLRPVVIPGNLVAAHFAARSDTQLPFLTLELVESRGPWLGEPLPAAALGWTTALTASALPERGPYPPIYDALVAVLAAICHAPSARGWLRGLVAYEALLLRELGYGGAEPAAGVDGLEPLLELFAAQGPRIARHLLADNRRDVMAARAMLAERLGRMTQ